MKQIFFDDKVKKIIGQRAKTDKPYSRFYKNIISRVKNEIEKMWDVYYLYAPRNFKSNMLQSKECFYQRWWEMYLGTKLLEHNFNISTNIKDIGPDFKIIINGEIYWIEAVAPECGENKVDSLEVMKLGVHSLPRREFLLRLSNAINNKIEKFKDYLEKGIVKEEDKLIIAISTCNLSQYGSTMDFPCLAIDTLLYNKGELSINLKTHKTTINEKNGVIKSNGSIIQTDIFNNKSCIIAGVIYTHDEPLNIYNKIYFRENDSCKVCNQFKEAFLNKKDD